MQPPDHLRAEVGEDVCANECMESPSPVAVAARHDIAHLVGILVNRLAQPGRIAVRRWVEAVAPFLDIPAIIDPTLPARPEVDLLPVRLAHITNEHIAGRPVKREAEGVA